MTRADDESRKDDIRKRTESFTHINVVKSCTLDKDNWDQIIK